MTEGGAEIMNNVGASVPSVAPTPSFISCKRCGEPATMRCSLFPDSMYCAVHDAEHKEITWHSSKKLGAPAVGSIGTQPAGVVA